MPAIYQRRTSPLTCLAVSILIGVTSAQREVEPSSRQDDATAVPKPHEPAKTMHGVAAGPFYEAPLDDLPDFAPYIDVGHVDNGDASGQGPRQVPNGNPYTLAFAGHSYEPPRGVDPGVRSLGGSHFYGYVMLRGRMTAPHKLRALDALGVQRLRAHTWQSWVAKIPLAAVDRIGELPFVHWVGLARPEQKIHPLLRDALEAADPGTSLRIEVDVFESDKNPRTRVELRGRSSDGESQDERPISFIVPNGDAHLALVEAGFHFEEYCDTGNTFLFRGTATPSSIKKIRDLPFVTAVELAVVYHGDDDQAHAMIGQDKVRASHGGGAVTVGVIDSGLWSPTAAQRHRDFQDKFLIGWDQVGTGVYNDERGHGTAVTGVMIGSGTADPRYRGGAPEIGRAASRRVFVGRLLDKDNKAVGSSQALFDALAKSYTDSNSVISPRPRVINNSWGASPPAGTPWIGTESGSRRVDDMVFNGGQAYVFSSGNSGPTQAAGSPAVAKNSLCVGSCWDNWDATVRPGDLRPTSAGGTADGRRKPDLLAPGRWNCTTVRNSTTGYGNFWGTSFAAPHVTGVVASLIDHHGFLDYKPSQIKALLCAAAEWQGQAGSTTGYFGTLLGHGLVDASKAHGDAETSWFSGGATGDFTQSGQWVYWDVTVPTRAEHMSLFLCWDEPAAAASATQARVNELRAYVDVEPFTAGGNTGEYSISSASSNVISQVGSAWAVALRGKKLRIKAHAQSIKTRARVGMAILWMTESPSITPELLVGVTKSVMKPGEEFQMAGTLRAKAGGHHFDNGVMRPALPSSVSVLGLRRVGLDAVVQEYTGTGHPSSPFPSLTDGMNVGQGMRRDLLWTLRAPSTSGQYSVGVNAWADPGDLNLNDSRTICVDGLAPAKVSGLTSSSHFVNRWYSANSLSMVWSQAVDSGCSGLRGYAYEVAQSVVAPTTVNILGVTNTLKTVNLTSSASGWYFNIKAADFAGNLSASTTSMGPFFVDTSDPVITSFSIDSGAERTKQLTVALRSTATDTYSGVVEMRFSSNGALWSPWIAYTTAPVSYDLSTYGGNTQDGPKQVQVEVRDRAGNSIKSSDTIVYDSIPPVVTSVLINGGSTVTSSLDVQVEVTGAGIPSQMRFSSDDKTWTPWQAYSVAAQNYDLRANGGSNATGTKRVYCQLRDAAGNESASKSDSIAFWPIPTISSYAPASIGTVHDTPLVLSGKFADINRVVFNGVPLAENDPHEWYLGYFVKRSDTTIEVWLPQNVSDDSQLLRVGNPGFLSAAILVPRVHPDKPIFQAVPQKVAGKPIDLVLHRGSFTANSLAILTLSGSSTKLSIPGLVELGHGGNATTFIDPSFIMLPATTFDRLKRTAHWTLPTTTSLKGAKLYFQPLLIDLGNPTKLPFTTANVDRVDLF